MLDDRSEDNKSEQALLKRQSVLETDMVPSPRGSAVAGRNGQTVVRGAVRRDSHGHPDVPRVWRPRIQGDIYLKASSMCDEVHGIGEQHESSRKLQLR
jgi:hypothetical protein